jgi:hypothetical protein
MEDEMDRACSSRGEERKAWGYYWEILKERDCLEGLFAGERIILKRILDRIEWCGVKWFKIEVSVGLLWTRQWTFELWQILGNSSVPCKVREQSYQKSAVFWDATLCGFCNNWRFGEEYRLHNQNEKIGELGTTLAVNSNRSTCHPDDGSDTFFRNTCS